MNDHQSLVFLYEMFLSVQGKCALKYRVYSECALESLKHKILFRISSEAISPLQLD